MFERIRGFVSFGAGHVKRSRPSRGDHVAIVTPSLAGRGAERKALHIGNGLLERGHDVDMLLQRLVCHYPDEVPNGARLYFMSARSDDRTLANMKGAVANARPLVPDGSGWRTRFPRIGLAGRLYWNQMPLLLSTRLPGWAVGIAEYLDRERPKAILAMNVLSVTAATMALRLACHSVRVVATLHEQLGEGRLLRRARCSYPHAHSVVGVSQGVSAEFARIPRVKESRVHVIYNPVVTEFLKKKCRGAISHPWLDSDGYRVVVAVGKLNRSKDFSTLLEAFARLQSSGGVRLIVLGEGRQRKSLLSLARRLGIENHVDFPGFVENPYAYLARADLFVLSSKNEALPTVLIEAMACGCPVVSTDCAFGPREILNDGEFGTLVPVGDPIALGDAMVEALQKPRRSEALRERAAFFRADRAVDRYEELLLGDRELVGSSRRGSGRGAGSAE